MDNSNLMLLCDTSNSESEIRKVVQVDSKDMEEVKIKIEKQDENQTNMTSIVPPEAEISETEAVSAVNPESSKTDVESSTDSEICLIPVEIIPVLDHVIVENNPQTCETITQISPSSNDKSYETETVKLYMSGSSLDTDSSFNDTLYSSNKSKSNFVEDTTDNYSKTKSARVNLTSRMDNDPTFQQDKVYLPQNDTAPSNSDYQLYPAMDQQQHQSETDMNEMRQPLDSINQPSLIPRQESYSLNQLSGPAQSDAGSIYIQNYAYNHLPGMDSLTDSSLQPLINQHALELSQQIARGNRPNEVGWNHPGQVDPTFGCPIASSTPSNRRRVLQDNLPVASTANLGQSYYPIYSEAGDQQMWYPHEKEQHMQWMPHMMPMMSRNTGMIAYNQPQIVYERNVTTWPVQRPQRYVSNENIPLDMTPSTPTAISRSKENSDQPTPSLRDDVQKAVKRSSSCLEADNSDDGSQFQAKLTKTIEKVSEDYQISTNVHTLKPRHILSWYIDYLIQENEHITRISKSSTWREVSIFHSKDMYFMEPLLRKCGFPTAKFIKWMGENFPNINMNAVDFTEGKQCKMIINYEEQICNKSRNEIIDDTFMYFQRQRAAMKEKEL